MKHNCLKVSERDSDYICGVSSPITLKSVSANWLPHLQFFEDQQDENGDLESCVIFAAQKSFDAQMDAQMASIPTSLITLFNTLGFMQVGLDGKVHFHSSARFISNLTGNGTNGNALTDPWDVMRKYGCVPWSVFPNDNTMTVAEYYTQPTQAMLNLGQQFLAAIGGKNAIQYHWITKSTQPQSIPNMSSALPTAPLCVAVFADAAEGWNTPTPPIPNPPEPPCHGVLNYEIDPYSNVWIHDDYQPNPKELVYGWSIPQCLQAVVTVTPPPPAPTPPPIPTNPTPAQIQQESNWLTQLSTWLQNLLNGIMNGIKGR